MLLFLKNHSQFDRSFLPHTSKVLKLQTLDGMEFQKIVKTRKSNKTIKQIYPVLLYHSYLTK